MHENCANLGSIRYHRSCIKILRVRSISFPPTGRPRSAPVHSNIALTSFHGLTRVSPQCPACGVGHFGVTRDAWRHRERASVIVRLALVRGSPEWAPRGWPGGAKRTHTHTQREKYSSWKRLICTQTQSIPEQRYQLLFVLSRVVLVNIFCWEAITRKFGFGELDW